MLNPARAVVGLARRLDDEYRPEHLREFLDLGVAVPMRLDHGPLILANGTFIQYLGQWRRAAVVEGDGVRPTGLIVLGEVDDGPYGDAALVALNDEPGTWGLSWGISLDHDERGQVEQVMPFEVSLTTRPKNPDSLVIASGPRAVGVWELLTGERVPVRQGATW